MTQQETERLITEQTKLRQMTAELETSQAVARIERQQLRQSNELEQARLDGVRERQIVEWSEMEKERRHQLALRQQDLQFAQQHLVIIDCLPCVVYHQQQHQLQQINRGVCVFVPFDLQSANNGTGLSFYLDKVLVKNIIVVL